MRIINSFYQGGIPGSTAEFNDFFGESLTVGGFDQDAVDDLAIGVPNEDVSAGDVTYRNKRLSTSCTERRTAA